MFFTIHPTMSFFIVLLCSIVIAVAARRAQAMPNADLVHAIIGIAATFSNMIFHPLYFSLYTFFFSALGKKRNFTHYRTIPHSTTHFTLFASSVVQKLRMGLANGGFENAISDECEIITSENFLFIILPQSSA